MVDFTIDAGIIAGGLGSRLEGADKGLLLWKGQPFVAHIAQRLRPFCQQLIINCNRNQPAYETLADKVVVDKSADFLGPLAGIQALLTASTSDYLLISPCDTPALPEDYAARMLDCLNKNRADDRQPMIAVDDGERQHPLHLLIPTGLAQDITEYLARGERKMMYWIKSHNPVWCDFSDEPEGFYNVNTPEEHQILEERM